MAKFAKSIPTERLIVRHEMFRQFPEHSAERRKFRQLPPIHFRAGHGNELWQVDVSPSDAKYFGDRMRRDGKTPRLYGVTDDHSGGVYAEYKELLEDPRRILFGLQGRLPDNDDLCRRIGVFLPGLVINFTSNAG